MAYVRPVELHFFNGRSITQKRLWAVRIILGLLFLTTPLSAVGAGPYETAGALIGVVIVYYLFAALITRVLSVEREPDNADGVSERRTIVCDGCNTHADITNTDCPECGETLRS